MGGRRAAALLATVAVALCAWNAAASAASLPWCGTGQPTVDQPDAVQAFEWHVLYAVPSDGADRFGSYVSRIAGDVATMSNWWQAHDSTRRPRFDLLEAPGCSTEHGRVDITFVRLPRPTGSYAFREIVADLDAAGFALRDKAYLVYYDGTIHAGDEYGICGQGGVARTAAAYAVVYLQTCGQSFSDETRAFVATHEVLHGLGAVPSDAPHRCDGGHVCDSGADIMKAQSTDGDWLGSTSLDVGRDDYYGHSGTWWDAQDSLLLYRLDQILPPPADIVNATATSFEHIVRVEWAPSVVQQGLFYRLYDEKGGLTYDSQRATTITATGEVGETLSWVIRSVNAVGFLGTPVTLRFKVGYGIVDAAGTVIRDTVEPGEVAGLRISRAGHEAVLRWRPVADPIGLRGYRVSAPGMKPVVVSATTARLRLARVRGKTVSVAGLDRGGNLGPAATARVPR